MTVNESIKQVSESFFPSHFSKNIGERVEALAPLWPKSFSLCVPAIMNPIQSETEDKVPGGMNNCDHLLLIFCSDTTTSKLPEPVFLPRSKVATNLCVEIKWGHLLKTDIPLWHLNVN